MYSAKAIANYFLSLAAAKGELISPMKLQKLVYYAHGWFSGHTQKPLINESVEAWPYGPVIPSLYHEFKAFGANPITRKATEFDITKLKMSEVELPADSGIQQFLTNVWNSYGQFTGTKLSEMTHAPDSPWDVTRKQNPNIKGADIPFDVISGHFKAAVEKSRLKAAQE